MVKLNGYKTKPLSDAIAYAESHYTFTQLAAVYNEKTDKWEVTLHGAALKEFSEG